MTALRPEALLIHARQLLAQPAGAGRPDSTLLRRSTSASYYALFHAISLAVVQQITPQSASVDRYRLARSMSHGKMAEVCRWIATPSGGGKTNVAPIVQRLRANADVRQLAQIFVRLQEARHEADYNHLASPAKSASSAHHAEGSRGLALVRSSAPTADGEAFFALIALHTPNLT